MARKDVYGNAFTFMLYPESINVFYAGQFLERTGYEVAISPLHCRDVYDEVDVAKWVKRHTREDGSIDGIAPVVGDPKKDHYHVIMKKSKGNTTEAALLKVLSELVNTDGPHVGEPHVKYVEKVADLEGMTCYLCHLRNPAKAEYDPNEIIYLNGYDESIIDGKTKADRSRAGLLGVLDLVDGYDLYNFAQLVQYVRLTEDKGLFDALSSRASFIAMYLQGRRELAPDKAHPEV